MTDRETAPHLAGALADRPRLKLSDRLRGRRLPMPWSIPDEALHEPLLRRKSIIGEMFIIGDPELARQVLVERATNYPKSSLELSIFSALFGQGLLGLEGDLWRKHRRTMAPAFAPASVAGYAPAMAACSDIFVDRWRDLPEGTVVDVAEEMTALTLSIISRTMFSDEGVAVEPVIRETLKGVPELSNLAIWDVLPLIGDLRMRQRKAQMATLFRPLDGEIARMIEHRSAAKDAPDDLLGRLVAARDDETGAGLSAEEIRDEIITIFMAGHETTSNALTWTWYLLAKHPREAARLHAEVDAVLGGRTPGQEDLASLPLTRRIVEESLRLFPPAPGMSARVAREADELAGHRVKPGSYMVIAPWVLQRHRLTWDEPERFDPDRFLPQRSQGRARLATMPFSAGPRICIGHLLAMNEIILVLATLAQHFELDLASDAPVELHHNITLRPRGGLRMKVRRRKPGRAAVAAE